MRRVHLLAILHLRYMELPLQEILTMQLTMHMGRHRLDTELLHLAIHRLGMVHHHLMATPLFQAMALHLAMVHLRMAGGCHQDVLRGVIVVVTGVTAIEVTTRSRKVVAREMLAKRIKPVRIK